MYILVKLLNGYQEPLLYKVPTSLLDNNLVGKLVRVPIRQRLESALVIDALREKPSNISFEIKEIAHVESFPKDNQYDAFIHTVGRYYCIDDISFIKRIRHFLEQESEAPDYQASLEVSHNSRMPELTNEQQAVVDYVTPKFVEPCYTPVLLHGVTGSGKTEVYKRLILNCMTQGKTVLLLLPEVTLALQFEALLKEQLPSIFITGFHSATTPAQKKNAWKQLIDGKPLLIIGVHLPALLPISNLGLIIIDEEHDVGYQEKKHPKINSKEVALIKAQQYGIPILLGSATPSVQTLHTCKTKQWQFFQLTQRFGGSFPQVRVVMLNDKKQRKNFWISTQLASAIKDRLAKKEQTIIFINRRGYSFFVQCKECSFIFGCPSCSVSLTLHEPATLSCHYCTISLDLPKQCSSCKKGADQFLKKGLGTQQVVSIIQSLFPRARIARADLDSTCKKKAWSETVAAMQQGEIDILIGTQTITKGYHFPKVTLVGVLWADLNLSFPIYNASEVTLQQLIQVAGRAGRQSPESLVIVQTMGDHTLYDYLNEIDYIRFYDSQIATRMLVKYPPCIRFAEFEVRHTDEEQLEADAQAIVAQAQQFCETRQFPLLILGPSKPPVYKIKGMNFRKIYVKADNLSHILSLASFLLDRSLRSHIFFTPNPLQ